MYVTAHSGTLKKNLADGVTNRLHAVQQGVNNVCTGNAVVVNGVEHFLIDAGAGSTSSESPPDF